MSADNEKIVLEALLYASRGKKIGKLEGVTVDATGRVIQLFLVDNNISGIPLFFLLHFLVNGNNFDTGSIPAELSQLSSLKMLWLFNNNLSG
jgi:hypothetical protein